MWIVRLALRRPYTFIVASILILILGTVAILRTPTDIFPNIDIPIISVIWQYNGLAPEEMSERIVYPSERGLTTTVSNIAHIDSQSWNGRSVLKITSSPARTLPTPWLKSRPHHKIQCENMPPGTLPPSDNFNTMPRQCLFCSWPYPAKV